MTQHRSTATAATVALVLTVGACADAPTAPATPSEASATPAVAAPSGPAAMLLLDASTRLLPSLGELALRGQLDRQLDALRTALAASDDAAVRRELAAARRIVARQQKAGDVADLAALSLAFDQIEAELDHPAQPTAQP